MLSLLATAFLATAINALPVRRDGASDPLSACLQGANVPFVTNTSSTWANATQPFNQRFDGQFIPAAVALVASTDDVIAAVGCAAQSNVATVARSGGHSYVAYSLGGANGSLVIDVAGLNTVSLDNDTGIAIIGSGNRLGDVGLALFEQGGRGFGFGTCPEVGIGGHALGGGFGLDSRAWGLSLDRVIAHDIVLANGSLVTVDNTTGSDLYWALRGGGQSSYGIVTAFHVDTFPTPETNVIYSIKWELDTTANPSPAAQAFAAFQEFALTSAPAALGAEWDLFKGSSEGTLSMQLAGAYMGTQDEFDSVIQPFLDTMPTPQNVTAQGYEWIQSLEQLAGHDVTTLNTSGVTDSRDDFFESSLMTPQSQPLTNDSWQAFASYLGSQGYNSDTAWFCQVETYGGANSAITAVAANETAFANRDVLFTFQLYASSSTYSPPYPADGVQFVQGIRNSIIDAMPSTFPVRAYVNYIEDDLSSPDWQQQYYADNYARLQQIKQAYDPNNLFRFPYSIEGVSS